MGIRVEREKPSEHVRAPVAAAVPSAAAVLALQRSAGNAAVARALLQRKPPADLAAAQQAFTAALAEHQAQSAILTSWVREGRQQKADIRTKNACDWIANGKSKLYAATPTGDMSDRLSQAKRSTWSQRAYFPKVQSSAEPGDIHQPGSARYNWQDLDDNNDVTFRESSIGGWNTSGAPSGVAIVGAPAGTGRWEEFTGMVGATITKEKFFTNLKHEVQHAADRHDAKGQSLMVMARRLGAELAASDRLLVAAGNHAPLAPADLAAVPPRVRKAFEAFVAAQAAKQAVPEDVMDVLRGLRSKHKQEQEKLTSAQRFEVYKTEYRAYSYEGSYKHLDNTVSYNGSVPSRFHVAGRPWTERQFTIFEHVHGEYEKVKLGWEADHPVYGAGKKFRQLVIEYRDPDTDGVNKWDSRRIDDFYNALVASPRDISDPSQIPAALLGAAKALRSYEAAYVRNAANAPRELTDLLAKHFAGPALTHVHTVLERRAPAKK